MQRLVFREIHVVGDRFDELLQGPVARSGGVARSGSGAVARTLCSGRGG